VLGHEALTRGLRAGFESPTTLIECASRHGLTLALERACLEAAPGYRCPSSLARDEASVAVRA
jgi:EAL domain-containing protein (putative c-di-GMP-specific phosphodiesterase class I)